jgi:two-component system chemotaxis response regulator CheY
MDRVEAIATMPKRVLSVGQCGPDHATIRAYLNSHFDCEIVRTHTGEDTFRELDARAFDLVLINRKLDADYSDGLEIIHRMKADPKTASVPVMMISNYPEHQDAAVEAGALRGFGKLEYDEPATRDRLAEILDERE